MPTRIATAQAHGSVSECASQLASDLKQQLNGAEPVLVVTFASTRQPLAELAPQLQREFPDSRVLGASTAGEFTQAGDSKQSAVAFALAGDFAVRAGIGKNIKGDLPGAITRATSQLPTDLDPFKFRTGILLLDPLAGNGEEAALLVAEALGDGVPLAGGAAGDDLAMSKTHVSCGSECETDALVIAVIYSHQPLGLGVSHGHVPLTDPVTVTKAAGGTVFEVDGRPAWEVWAEMTRASAAERGIDPARLEATEVGAYLLRYEAGLSTGESLKIRAPLSRNEDGSLHFACGLPEGAVIRITESVPERQIESAVAAARQAREGLGGARPAGALIFDCICRNLILGKDFKKAVQGMSEELGGAPLVGFETYGEIAMLANDMSGFHNTTTVVLAVPE